MYRIQLIVLKALMVWFPSTLLTCSLTLILLDLSGQQVGVFVHMSSKDAFLLSKYLISVV